jgi:hypothetical protein
MINKIAHSNEVKANNKVQEASSNEASFHEVKDKKAKLKDLERKNSESQDFLDDYRQQGKRSLFAIMTKKMLNALHMITFNLQD